MSVTLFTTPRPFKDHYQIIQVNALKSWGLLDPPPTQVLVFADREHEGDLAVDFAEEQGFQVVPVLRRSPYCVPLVSDLFSRAQEMAGDGIACYVNADILMDNSLVPGLEKAVALAEAQKKDGVLAVCRRWNVHVLDYMEFEEGWREEIWQKVTDQGSLIPPCAIDLFAWKGEVWVNIPDFAIGRYAWDNWLIGNASARGVPVVDVTKVVRIIHQPHQIVPWEDPDATENFQKAKVMGGMQHCTHTLTEDGLVDGWLG